MANPPLTARRQARLAAVAALDVLESTGAVRLLNSPGVWPSPPETLPAVLVRAPRTSKESLSPGSCAFGSTVTLEIETRLSEITAEDAQDAIENLDALVEQALLTNTAFVSLFQKMSIDTDTDITPEGRVHIAGTKMHFRGELVEAFDPICDAPASLQPVAPPLEGVDLHADLVSQYDPTGIYGDLLFPPAVQPAPRTSGPDGRDEGGFKVNFPTEEY